MSNWTKIKWSTGAGVGFIPCAPGTWGSLQPVAIVLVCGHFGLAPVWMIVVLLSCFLSTSIATLVLYPWYTEYFQNEDPPQVVCDEVAGQSIGLLGMAWLVPSEHVSTTIWFALVLLSFVLFRVFDIWKPWIIHKAQQLPSGWGVLVDDLLAGVATCAIVLATALSLV